MGRSRDVAKLAKDIDDAGNFTVDAISPDVTLGGATVYNTSVNLPQVGNTEGDQAFALDTSRLYIWNGSGWYNVSLLNLAPSITSVQDSDGNTTPFSLLPESVTTITVTAVDSADDPITYGLVADSDFSGIATISQDGNEFTITSLSEDSATAESGTITFTASDGINVGTSEVQTFNYGLTNAIKTTVEAAAGGYYFDYTDISKFNSGGLVVDGTDVTSISAITPATTLSQADTNEVTWDSAESSLLKDLGNGYYTIPISDVEGTTTTVGDHIFGTVIKSNSSSSGQARIARFEYADGSKLQWGMNNSGTDCWASSRPDGESFASHVFDTNLDGSKYYGIIWEYVNSTRTWTVHVVDDTGAKTSHSQESGGPTADTGSDDVTLFGTYIAGSYEQVGNFKSHFLAFGSYTSQEISDLLDFMYTEYLSS